MAHTEAQRPGRGGLAPIPAYLSLGEKLSPVGIGGLAGAVTAGLVDEGWGVAWGVAAGLANGIAVQALTLFLLMPLFGAFEIMVPCMLAGMLGGMAAGAAASMVGPYSTAGLLIGGAVGFAAHRLAATRG